MKMSSPKKTDDDPESSVDSVSSRPRSVNLQTLIPETLLQLRALSLRATDHKIINMVRYFFVHRAQRLPKMMLTVFWLDLERYCTSFWTILNHFYHIALLSATSCCCALYHGVKVVYVCVVRSIVTLCCNFPTGIQDWCILRSSQLGLLYPRARSHRNIR